MAQRRTRAHDPTMVVPTGPRSRGAFYFLRTSTTRRIVPLQLSTFDDPVVGISSPLLVSRRRGVKSCVDHVNLSYSSRFYKCLEVKKKKKTLGSLYLSDAMYPNPASIAYAPVQHRDLASCSCLPLCILRTTITTYHPSSSNGRHNRPTFFFFEKKLLRSTPWYYFRSTSK